MRRTMKSRIAGLAVFFALAIGAAGCAGEGPTAVEPEADGGPCHYHEGRWVCL